MKRLFIIFSSFAFLAFTSYAQKQEPVRNDVAGREAERTKTPFFESLALGVDLVGPVMYNFSDYGDFQASLQANIKGRYLPVVELGYGKAEKDYDDENVRYATSAPFVRIGCDMNILRNKHDDYLLLVGVRYGMTSFDFDTTPLEPKENEMAGMVTEDCTLQWFELAFGVDAKVWGPLHMGWSFRYRKRLSISDCQNKPLYAPGFGNADGSSQFMALYTIGIHL